MTLRFSKENMYTAAGFLLDSFTTDQADFLDVAPGEFNADFVKDFKGKRGAIKGATGGVLRAGTTAQITERLYANLDKVKPLLDRLDIRLGFVPAKSLTVSVKKFGLKELRVRLDARDAEAASRALTVLRQAITDNLTVLKDKGYVDTELSALTQLHADIDEDNGKQNQSLNTNTKATDIEDGAYQALDRLLGKIMRTGRLLYKASKTKRRQYEVAAILKRMQAGELPKADEA